MKNRHIQIVLAGTALTMSLSGCPKESEPTPSPEPSVSGEVEAPVPVPAPVEMEDEVRPPMPIITNPPPSRGQIVPQEAAVLPTWDEVVSGHPQGATNPPTPELIVTPDGDCYKRWVGRQRLPDQVFGDRVQECPEPSDCGTQIQCPDEAGPLLDAWKAEQGSSTE